MSKYIKTIVPIISSSLFIGLRIGLFGKGKNVETYEYKSKNDNIILGKKCTYTNCGLFTINNCEVYDINPDSFPNPSITTPMQSIHFRPFKYVYRFGDI